MWLRKHFNDEWKRIPSELVRRLQTEFISSLQNAMWMDETTRSLAIEKSEAMRSFIAYPEWLLNDTKIEMAYDGVKLQLDDYLGNRLRVNQLKTKEQFEVLRIPDDRNAWPIYDDIPGISTLNAYHAAKYNTMCAFECFHFNISQILKLMYVPLLSRYYGVDASR